MSPSSLPFGDPASNEDPGPLDKQSAVFTEMSEEDMGEWVEEKIELYGDDWPKVETLLAQLRKWKIYLGDVKPGNITVRKN